METKIKWNEGEGYITATYEGSGSGSASIASDINEGIDRAQSIKVETTDKSVSATLVVTQEGMREVFEPSDGGFVLADGGTFNVLKVGGDTPDVPEILYEEIEYVTFDGNRVFDTLQYGNNRTTIELKFKRTNVTTAVYLFGCDGGSNNIINAYLNSNGNWRYGNKYRIFNTRTTNVYEAELTPEGIKVGSYSVSFTANEFTTPHTLSVGGYTTTSGVKDAQYIGYIYSFRMYIDDVAVVDWIPVRRLSDGLECFWDKVTQSFVEPI